MPFKKAADLQQMNLLFDRRAPLHLPAERQRDLTAALADLLLNAASARFSEHTTVIGKEGEDASEANR